MNTIRVLGIEKDADTFIARKTRYIFHKLKTIPVIEKILAI